MNLLTKLSEGYKNGLLKQQSAHKRLNECLDEHIYGYDFDDDYTKDKSNARMFRPLCMAIGAVREEWRKIVDREMLKVYIGLSRGQI